MPKNDDGALQKRRPLASNTRTMYSRLSNMSCSFSSTNPRMDNARNVSFCSLSPLTCSHVPRALIRMMAALGVSAGSRMHETDVDGVFDSAWRCTDGRLCVTGERRIVAEGPASDCVSKWAWIFALGVRPRMRSWRRI